MLSSVVVTLTAWMAAQALGLSRVPASWQLHGSFMAAADADMAVQLAEGPQPDVLPRGAGMLVLFDNNWGGKAVQLQAGRVVIEEQHFTPYSIVQLMSEAGLLLWQKSAQMVQLRVAAEFLSVQQHPLIGHWSQKAYNLRVTPGSNLLLHCQPTHTWGKKFTASCSAACSSYGALFPGFLRPKSPPH
jgi:hypothetical protein